MIPAITAVFEFLQRNLGPFLSGFWGLMRRVKWFSVGIVLVSVTILEYVISFFAWAGYVFATQTSVLAGQVRGLINSANVDATWASMSQGAALMNCVLPLDFMLAVGSAVMTFWFSISVILSVIAIWKLIPLKST